MGNWPPLSYHLQAKKLNYTFKEWMNAFDTMVVTRGVKPKIIPFFDSKVKGRKRAIIRKRSKERKRDFRSFCRIWSMMMKKKKILREPLFYEPIEEIPAVVGRKMPSTANQEVVIDRLTGN